MGLGTDWASRLARGTFVLLMTLAWTGMPQGAQAADAAAKSATNTPRPAELAEAIGRIVKLYSAMDRDLPRDTFDLAAVVNKAGTDPEALFAWVRDNTSYVPYRGMLRGPMGVLMDRNGNSLDRALLLARLLQAAGRQARLARGTIAAEQAESLLKRVWEDPASGLAVAVGSAPPDDASLAHLTAKYDLDPVETRRSAAKLQLTHQRSEEDLIGTVSEQSEALAALLGAGAGTKDEKRAERLAALADHWWVQGFGGGKWIDLDPLMRDAKSGVALAVASATVDLPADGTLPPELAAVAHEVELRVKIEGVDKSVAHTEVVFHHTLKPAELAGSAVRLQISSLEWPQDLDLTTGNPGATMKAVLARQQNFIPSLEINGKPNMQGSFDVHGRVNAKPDLDALAKFGKSTGGAAQRAANVLDDKPPEEEATGELTAVWLEYEIRVPGEKPRVISRDLFDAVGPAKRAASEPPQVKFDDALRLKRAVSIYREINILAAGCVPSTQYVLHLALSNVIANGPVAAKALRESPGKTLKQTVKDFAPIQRFPALLWALASDRRQQVGCGASLAVDRPNLFTLHDGYWLNPGGELDTKKATDIVANEVAVRGPSSAEAFKAHLAQGVLETAQERRMIESTAGGVNTVSLFAASEGQKVRWVKLSSPDAPELAQTTLTADTQARIRGDLRAGYVVLAPTAPVTTGGQPREGWWRIDPRDGSSLGFAADGTGASATEYAIVLVAILIEAGFAFHCLKETGGAEFCIGCFCISAAIDVAGLLIPMPALATVAVAGGSFGGARLCEHLAEH